MVENLYKIKDVKSRKFPVIVCKKSKIISTKGRSDKTKLSRAALLLVRHPSQLGGHDDFLQSSSRGTCSGSVQYLSP